MLAIDRSSPWDSMLARTQLDPEQASIFLERRLPRAGNCTADWGSFGIAAQLFQVDFALRSCLFFLILWTGFAWKLANADGTIAEVAEQAYQRSHTGQLVASVRAEVLAAPTKKHFLVKPKISEQERNALCNLSIRMERQLRFETSVNAIRLHYGIAACLQALEDGKQLRKEIDGLLADQQLLIDKGLAIEDPTALERAKIACEDNQLTLESKLSTLREELSVLVDPAIACDYASKFVVTPFRSLDALCEVQQEALRQREDLQAIHYAIHNLPGASDAAWEIALRSASQAASAPGVTSMMASTGSPASNKSSPSRLLSWFLIQRGENATPQRRAAILKQLYRTKFAEVEIAVARAFHARELAADRWSLAVDTTNTWQTRLEQLIALEKVQGTLAQQVETKLEIYRARSHELERWLEWHLADCDLQLATGAYGYWNREESPTMDRNASKANEETLSLEGPSQREQSEK